MQKRLENPSIRGSKHDETVREVADIFGVTPSYVRKIRDGLRDHDEIFDAYMQLKEGKNQLLEQVKQLVPFKK